MNDHAVGLPFAVGAALVGLVILLWVTVRLVFEHRAKRAVHTRLLDRVPDELRNDLDVFLAEIHVMRERASAWSGDDFVVAQSTLEALDRFRDELFEEITDDTLDAATSRIRALRTDFERNPGIEALASFRDGLDP